jgi:hypothetical protein
MPTGSEYRREEIAQAVCDAVAIVETFAAENAWTSLTKEPFFSRIEISPSKDALWQRLLELNQLPLDTPPPSDAVTAALDKGSLMAVFFEEAQRARPEYFKTHLDWVQTLAHEMVHQLHVRILNGNEDAMGPQWFYEGFAIIGSGQPLGRDIAVANIEKAFELTTATGRGSYACYAAALHFFMEHIPLQRLVEHAADPDFEALLRAEATAG